MTDSKTLIELVQKCENILAQVESHASAIDTLYKKIEQMVSSVETDQVELNSNQELKIKKELMKVAKKAAKKAAKKSLAIAQAKENIVASKE